MDLFGVKTVASLKRGLEAGLSATIGYLAIKWLGSDPLTATGIVDVVEDHLDTAAGTGIAAFLALFGYTRSPAKNISTVAENVPPPDGPVVDVKDDEAVAEAEASAPAPPPDEAA